MPLMGCKSDESPFKFGEDGELEPNPIWDGPPLPGLWEIEFPAI